MVYLQSFTMLTQDQEERFFISSAKASRTCYDSKYPFGLFRYRDLPELYFSDITIFYGNNGSGKSTILNVIAEKLGLARSTPYNRTDFFADYVALSDYTLEKTIPRRSSSINTQTPDHRMAYESERQIARSRASILTAQAAKKGVQMQSDRRCYKYNRIRYSRKSHPPDRFGDPGHPKKKTPKIADQWQRIKNRRSYGCITARMYAFASECPGKIKVA